MWEKLRPGVKSRAGWMIHVAVRILHLTWNKKPVGKADLNVFEATFLCIVWQNLNFFILLTKYNSLQNGGKKRPSALLFQLFFHEIENFWFIWICALRELCKPEKIYFLYGSILMSRFNRRFLIQLTPSLFDIRINSHSLFNFVQPKVIPTESQ